MLAAGLGVMGWTLADSDLTHQLQLQIGVFCAGLFLACMFCHGELARLKPSPRYLTRFYLMVSLGGAIGSALVGLVAPLVLPAYFELALGLVACAGLLVFQVRRMHFVFVGLATASLLFSVGAAGWSIHNFYENTVLATRNFYGVLRVQEWNVGTATYHRSLIHGTILHGTQYPGPALERHPSAHNGLCHGSLVAFFFFFLGRECARRAHCCRGQDRDKPCLPRHVHVMLPISVS